MNQYEFGYFPRNKYKDLVFYVKTGEHSNMGLFEMEDTEENRSIMDALRAHPYQSERDKVLNDIDRKLKQLQMQWGACDFWSDSTVSEIKDMLKELRQQAGEP
jgi:Leu/Phe-tRNA-protein transferase